MYSRYLKIEGNSRERGIKIGENIKDRIDVYYVNLIKYSKTELNIDFNEFANRCIDFMTYIEKYAPNTKEEIYGIVEGSKHSINKVLALNVAYDLTMENCPIMHSDKCTAFSVFSNTTLDNMVICGQTNDESFQNWPSELDMVFHHKDISGLETIIYTHPGVVAYMGMNNAGISILWTYIDNGERQIGLPTNIIIREMLTMCSLEEIEDYLKSIPHSVPNNFIVTHKSGKSMSFECFPNKVYTYTNSNYITHTNHNLFSDNEEDKSASWSSKDRISVIEELIKENYGSINIDIAKDFLRSHRRFPASICSHPNINRPLYKTLCSMIFDLTNLEAHIAFGNACEWPYNLYKFDSSI